MTTRTMGSTRPCAVFALLMALTASGGAFAQEHGLSAFDGHGAFSDHGAIGGQEGFAHQHVDTRFSHNQHYFDRGYAVHEPPHGSYQIDHSGDHYRYDRGEWYRGDGLGWVVTGAQVGAFVPVLPLSYTIVWLGAMPYFYANDTYYSWNGDQQEYEVMAPPGGIESAATTQPPGKTIFVRPVKGQSSEQQARDRVECHQSAVEQTGYEPTPPGGSVPPNVAADKRADYSGAEKACLDARGYGVS